MTGSGSLGRLSPPPPPPPPRNHLTSSVPRHWRGATRGTFGFTWETREKNTASLLSSSTSKSPTAAKRTTPCHVTSVRRGDSRATDSDGMQRARAVSRGGRTRERGRGRAPSRVHYINKAAGREGDFTKSAFPPERKCPRHRLWR